MSAPQELTKQEKEIAPTSSPNLTAPKTPSPKTNTLHHQNTPNFIFPPPPTCTSIPSSPASTFHSPASSSDIHISPTTTQPPPSSHSSSKNKKSDKGKTFESKLSSQSKKVRRHGQTEAVINDLCTILKRVDQRLQKIEDANERTSRSEKTKAVAVTAENEAHRTDVQRHFKHLFESFEAMQKKLAKLEGESSGLNEAKGDGKGKGKEVEASPSTSTPAPTSFCLFSEPLPSNPSVAGTTTLKEIKPSWFENGKNKEKEVLPAYTSAKSKPPRVGLSSRFSDRSSLFSSGLRTRAPPPTSAGSSSYSTRMKDYKVPMYRSSRPDTEDSVRNPSSAMRDGRPNSQTTAGKSPRQGKTPTTSSHNRESPLTIRARPGLFAQDVKSAQVGSYDLDGDAPHGMISFDLPPRGSFSSTTYNPESSSSPNLFDPSRIHSQSSKNDLDEDFHSILVSHTLPDVERESLRTGATSAQSFFTPTSMFPVLGDVFKNPINNVAVNSPIGGGYPLGVVCPPHGTMITHTSTGFTQPVDEEHLFFNTNVHFNPGTPFEFSAGLTFLAINHYLTDPVDFANRNLRLTHDYLSAELSQQDYWNFVGPGSVDLTQILMQIQNPYEKRSVHNVVGRLIGDFQNAVIDILIEIPQGFVDRELAAVAERVLSTTAQDVEFPDNASEIVTLRGGLGRLTPSDIENESTIHDSWASSSISPSLSGSTLTSSSSSSTLTHTLSHQFQLQATEYRNTTLAKAYLSGRLTQEEYWNICGPGFKSGHYLRQTPTSTSDSSPHAWDSFMAFDFSDEMKEVGLSQEFVDAILEKIAEGLLISSEMGSEDDDSENGHDANEVSVLFFKEGFNMATFIRGGGLGDQETIPFVSPSAKGGSSILSPTAAKSSSILDDAFVLDTSSEVDGSNGANDDEDELESTPSTERLTLNSMYHRLSSQQQGIAWNDAATMLNILQDEGESPWPFSNWVQAWDLLQVVQRHDGEDTPLSGALGRFLQIREEGGERGEAVKFIVGEEVEYA